MRDSHIYVKDEKQKTDMHQCTRMKKEMHRKGAGRETDPIVTMVGKQAMIKRRWWYSDRGVIEIEGRAKVVGQVTTRKAWARRLEYDKGTVNGFKRVLSGLDRVSTWECAG
jgi:hypothetical protein